MLGSCREKTFWEAQTGQAGWGSAVWDERLVSLVTPASFEAEQYRGLRDFLFEQFHTTGDLQVVAVSSPGPGDGKTTTAINLRGRLLKRRRLACS